MLPRRGTPESLEELELDIRVNLKLEGVVVIKADFVSVSSKERRYL